MPCFIHGFGLLSELSPRGLLHHISSGKARILLAPFSGIRDVPTTRMPLLGISLCNGKRDAIAQHKPTHWWSSPISAGGP